MRVFFTCILFLFLNGLYSQSGIINSPSVIASSGGTLIQNEYNLCFSLGELAIETFIEGDVILTEGFHQDNYQISQISEIPSGYQIDIYPNPTKDILRVDCNKLGGQGSLSIKNIKGSEVYFLSTFLTQETQSIDLTKLTQGVYFLEILLNSKDKIVYQIQKFN